MSATLVIRDGDPWWLSEDLWVTPNTPDADPANPGVGIPNFVWGRVRNNGKDAVKGATVRFYWSDPTTGVLRSNSTLIGTSFVDLAPGEVREVLCLTPWVAVVVNEGHECIVGEVVHAADPLPMPLPDAFDPPTYHQIAQRNLSVVVYATAKLQMFIWISVSASARRARSSTLEVEATIENLSSALLRSLGVRAPAAATPWITVGLSKDPNCGEIGNPRMPIKVRGGESIGVTLNIRKLQDQPTGYQVVHVRERDGHGIVGGTSFIVVPRSTP